MESTLATQDTWDDDEDVDDGPDFTDPADYRRAMISQYIAEMTVNPGVTDKQWCEQNNVPVRTLGRWKKRPEFKTEQKKFVSRKHLDPTRLGAVLENLWKIASQEKGTHAVTAASMYIKYCEALEPAAKVDAEVPVGFREMTNDQLVAAAMVAPQDYGS